MSEDPLFQKILLLEDDSGHALLIRRALRSFATEVCEVGTPAEAYTQLGLMKFDLIVADLHLPGTQGVGHVGKLRDAGGRTPVLVLTSSTSLEEAVEAMKLGACDFLVKNFDSQFNHTLHLALSRIHAAERLNREREKLQREMAALRMAIENGSDGLAVLKADGSVGYANTAFREFVEKCGGQAKRLNEFFSPRVMKGEELIGIIEEKRKMLPVGAVWHSEVGFVGEKQIAFGLSLSVIQRTSDDIGTECVLWVRNISEQKRREQFQREILSTTTHDLKGPLGAIMISADLVGDMVQDNQKAAQLILRIASSAQGALTLIDEFLSARRIQEGSFILHPQHQDVAPVLEEALAPFGPVAASRGIQLELSATGPLGARVDKLGLSRVVGNLVSNALKFTPKGGKVTVISFLHGEQLHIQVNDTGSGMEPAEVTKLFERFSRLDRHKDIAGSGLGLFVVRSIVSAHGGRIEVTSKLGEGTMFDISLPTVPPVNAKGELICLDFA